MTTRRIKRLVCVTLIGRMDDGQQWIIEIEPRASRKSIRQTKRMMALAPFVHSVARENVFEWIEAAR